MTLNKKERVRLIFEISELLEDEPSLERINIILNTYGLSTVKDSFESPSILEVLGSGSDENVEDLADHFDLDYQVLPSSTHEQKPQSASPLLIFASHLYKHKSFIHEVKTELDRYGINLFVAHDSIPADSIWQEEIERSLDCADAGLAFLHDDFRESPWCNQEVGWLLGRRVPVMSLQFDNPPEGPLAKHQAPDARNKEIQDLVSDIIRRISAKKLLLPSLAESLIAGMSKSPGYSTTDLIWHHLKRITSLDHRQCSALLDACKNNNQIYGAYSFQDGKDYPEAILQFLEKQPGYSEIQQDAESYSQQLATS